MTNGSESRNLLPGKPGDVGVTAHDNRRCVEAVLYRYRAGIPWRDLPERFGDWKNTHKRFSRWAKKGVWQRLFERLAAEADNEYAMIDSTIVRAHQHSAGAPKKDDDQAIGRSKGGLSTKIHALVDALGNPLRFSADRGTGSRSRRRRCVAAANGRRGLDRRQGL